MPLCQSDSGCRQDLPGPLGADGIADIDHVGGLGVVLEQVLAELGRCCEAYPVGLFTHNPWYFRDFDQTGGQGGQVQPRSPDDNRTQIVRPAFRKSDLQITQPSAHRIRFVHADVAKESVRANRHVLMVRPCRQDLPACEHLQGVGVDDATMRNSGKLEGQRRLTRSSWPGNKYRAARLAHHVIMH